VTKEIWREYAELVGIAAIVGSLVFVGLQLKQSQDIAIAGQYQERYTSSIEFFSTYSQDAWYTNLFGQIELNDHPEAASIFSPAGDTPEDVGRVLALLQQLLSAFDNHHFQYTSGFMTEDGWQMQRGKLKEVVATPQFYHLMQEHKHYFRPSFLEFCFQLRDEALNANPRTEPD